MNWWFRFLMSRTSYIFQNICYYSGTYKIGIYERRMTEPLTLTWTSMMGLRSKLTRTENDRNYEWLMQIDMKWFKIGMKILPDEIWHFKEVQRMTAAEPQGIHTLRSKICSYCVAITVVIILYSLKCFPPLKDFPCSKNHWYIKV